MEFNSPSTVNLVCLNIYNTVQSKIETSIYYVGGAPTRKSAAAAAASRCPKIGGGGATKKVVGGGAARPAQVSSLGQYRRKKNLKLTKCFHSTKSVSLIHSTSCRVSKSTTVIEDCK